MSTKYTSKLKGKRVLVIGGTSGIGFCVAEASVEHGAIVFVASSKQENIDKTIERIRSSYPDAGDRIQGHLCDLASPDVESNIKALLDFATNKQKEKLDHIVNTAGDSFALTKLEDATPEAISKFSTVRFVGSIMVAKQAVQYMHNSVASSFTMTGGANSTKPSAGWSVLAGSGTAKEGLTRGLAIDMKPIRMNCVSPGAVRTELFDKFGNKEMIDRIVETFRAKSLTQTIGNPEDVAESYLYLMKDQFVTGIVLDTNGGYFLA